MLDTWNGDRKTSIRNQLAAAEALGVSEKAATMSMTEEAIRKRREREEKRLAAARAKAIAEGLEPGDNASAVAVAKEELERSSTPSTSSAHPYIVEVPATSSAFAWYAPEPNSYHSIASARAAGIWDYPSDIHERAKCGVFKDLWEKGNFMGSGIRFGGDYLVYPGKSIFPASRGAFSHHPGFRRPDALPFTLRRHDPHLASIPGKAYGDSCPWSFGHCNKESASHLWLGR